MPNSSETSPPIDHSPGEYVHSISQAGRLLPSANQWNSIELDFRLVPKSNSTYDSLPSQFSKSYDFHLVITDKQYFKRCLYISLALIFLVVAAVLLLHFLVNRSNNNGNSKDLTLALRRALTFFDAQKSGNYPSNSPVKFRGDSGLQDGDSVPGGLVGGFYDSGNNMKFSFPTAYTVTLLSWTVIEYHHKYADIGELDHVKDIIKWGTDYLLELFVPPNSDSSPIILYSQVGSGGNETEGENNDISCWQRPEDMSYSRPVSSCDATASDLAGEITAALSAASIVFQQDEIDYSKKLIEAAQTLFEVSSKNETVKQGTYTSVETCGGQATRFYNSSGYIDELVWGGTWLYFATGNDNYLRYATDHFREAEEEEAISDKPLFYWNNKLTANAVLLTRLLYFRDMGFPFEDVLHRSSNDTRLLICSYLSQENFQKTPGGLMLLNSDNVGPLQFAATASFLTKLYSDYSKLVHTSGLSCIAGDFSLEMLHDFAEFQVNYILGDNPKKMSYMVGFGDKYPTRVHHRAASIRWDGQPYGCEEGVSRWLNSKEKNPNILYGAMVGGPDRSDNFLDDRSLPMYTEPSIASNAGLVAALIALHNPPSISPDSNAINLGMDINGIFSNIKLN